ncbi:MAG: endopeptidase La [Clostridiales bacterium]|nr:endopeptidase La [Clostridiales bacterium]
MTQEETKTIPVLALRGLTLYPNMTLNFDVGREKSLAALNQAMDTDQMLCLVTQRDTQDDDPTPDRLYAMGTLGRIKQLLRLPNDTVRVLVEGFCRAEIVEYTQWEPYIAAEVRQISDISAGESLEAKALIRSTMDRFEEYMQLSGRVSPETLLAVGIIDEPGRMADTIAANAIVKLEEKQEILEVKDPLERLERLLVLLTHEIDVQRIEQKINHRVRKSIDRMQKEHYLHEQIKAIQQELGEDHSDEMDEFRKAIEELPLDDEVREKCLKELSRLENLPSGSPEIAVLRTWIEWITELPWNTQTEDNMDLRNAMEILEEDHYGLEKVKERVVEYLAVRAMTNTMKGPILCFVGPPGVGKTSIARSIARALGRKFVRMSLGGVRDEAEIRGHRRTYIGAIPGRIMSNIKLAKTNNPVFLFDEVDKMGHDFRGDPASALLEVLDSEQNFSFRDHYLEVPFDLSRVMFLATANTTDTIPPPLLDRMEIIHISGYTDEEKVHIAVGHLIPKQIHEHGLPENALRISDTALLAAISGYTREAGVRSLDREIAHICRKAARILQETGRKRVIVTPVNLEKYLGIPVFRRQESERVSAIGVAKGLAWTSVGGVTLDIEVNVMDGTGQLELTGQLGDVMKESAKAALSYIRANIKALGVNEQFHSKKDIHIHIPEGATPKDGPSAGITMATAMASALIGKPVRGDIAMTGEITLRGRVLPIGGVKEKTLAAYREGITTIILPRDNERSTQEIPPGIRKKMKFVFVDSIDEVLACALGQEEGSH